MSFCHNPRIPPFDTRPLPHSFGAFDPNKNTPRNSPREGQSTPTTEVRVVRDTAAPFSTSDPDSVDSGHPVVNTHLNPDPLSKFGTRR